MESGTFVWGLSLFWNIGSTLWMFWEKRSDKTAEKLRELESRVGEINADIEKIQAVAERAPTHSDIGKVYEAMRELSQTTNDSISILATSTNASISNLSGTVNQLVGENRGQSDTLRLILNRLTEKKDS